MPSSLAFFSLLPAFSPATTYVVFFETDEAAFVAQSIGQAFQVRANF